MLSGAEPEIGTALLDVYIGEKDCWGKGFGTEAVRLMCGYGFGKMRLHRIGLWVAAPNAAAVHLYQKLGFIREGRVRDQFRDCGRWQDMLIMGMLESEWTG